jgi:hypothetical protein
MIFECKVLPIVEARGDALGVSLQGVNLDLDPGYYSPIVRLGDFKTVEGAARFVGMSRQSRGSDD